MDTGLKLVLPAMMGAMALGAVAMTPALADSAKKTKPSVSRSSSAAQATISAGSPAPFSSGMTGERDHGPGPAWRTIGGTVKQIKGDTYMVEDYEGNQVQLYVGKDTKHLRQKKVGDTVRAEITRGGFANSIQ